MHKLLKWSGVTLIVLVLATVGVILNEFRTTSTFELIVVYMDEENPEAIRWGAEQALYVFHPAQEDVKRLNREAGARYAASLSDTREAESVLRHLVANGLDINSVDEVDGSGFTALHAAVLSNDHSAVKVLLKEGADPGVTDREGRTPLELADVIARNRPDRDFGRVIQLLEQAEDDTDEAGAG